MVRTSGFNFLARLHVTGSTAAVEAPADGGQSLADIATGILGTDVSRVTLAEAVQGIPNPP